MTSEQYQIDKVKKNIPKWFKNPNQINSTILLKFLEIQNHKIKITIDTLEYECDLNTFKSNFAKMIDFTEKNNGKVFEVINDNIYLWKPVKEFILNEYSKHKNQVSQKIYNNTNIIYPDEIEDNNLYEGTKKQITVNSYERSQDAREECIQHYGYKCQICEFDFEKVYGEIGKDFIHVHHKVDISTIGENYKVNPIKDLIPVCPNCHAMLHKRKPAYNPEEIKSQILTGTYNKS